MMKSHFLKRCSLSERLKMSVDRITSVTKNMYFNDLNNGCNLGRVKKDLLRKQLCFVHGHKLLLHVPNDYFMHLYNML